MIPEQVSIETAATATSSATRPLRALLVCSIVLPALLFGYAAITTYHTKFAGAKQELQGTDDVVYEHAAKVFDTHLLVLKQVNQLLEGLSDAQIQTNEASFHAKLAAIIADLPQITDIFVVDRNGHPLVTAGLFPVPRNVDFSDREYFIAQRDHPQPVYVAGIQRGRLKPDAIFFNVSTRRATIDGSFNGAVSVSVSPQYFEEFYRRIIADEGPGFAISMSRFAGDILVRVPPPSAGSKPIVGSDFKRQVLSEPNRGTFELVSAVDGVDRLVAYRRLDSYPIYFAASMPRSTVLWDWLGTIGYHLIFGIPATICLFGMTLLALRRTAREAAALAMASEEARRRLNAELALSQAQKMEAVGQLTGGIAHDFNNLLTAILGNIDLIESTAGLSDRAKRLAGAARKAAERGATLTNSLLAFSRRQPLKIETLDVNAIVHEFVPLADRAIGETITLKLLLTATGPHCHADAAQLEAAILNLVINARDAMADTGGVLTIITNSVNLSARDLGDNDDAKPGNFVAISVRDTGAGIAPEIIGHVFEPFFTTKDVGRGSGLGLSQVFGFVRQSGGHITIESTPDLGTTVTLLLPAAEPTKQLGSSNAPSGAIVSLVPATILLVEDDPDVLEVTKLALIEANMRVLTAADGVEALRILEGPEPLDLLLSDVVMPNRLSGVELGRRARMLRPGIRVLLISGYANATLIQHGVAEGEFELISKPYRAPELATRILALLDRPIANTSISA